MAYKIRIADEFGQIYIDRAAFPYASLEAIHYLPPSNDIAIQDSSGNYVLRQEWTVVVDATGNAFAPDLLATVSALNTLFRYGTGGTGVTSVTGTAPIVSSGGTTPAISITDATTSAAGAMTAADKTKLDGIASGAEVNVNADWNAVSGDAEILNKPTIPSTFLDLSDTPATYVNNNVVQVNAGGTALEFRPQIRDLSDLLDCNVSSPQNGQLLKYDSASLAFRNSTPVIGDMSDVDGTTPNNNDVLTYDTTTSQWRPAAGGGGGGSNSVWKNWAFFDSTIRDVYIPMVGETETNSQQRYNVFVTPSAGSVTKITFYVTGNMSGGTGGSIQIRKSTGAATYATIGTATFSSLSAYGVTTLTYSGATFTQNDRLYFWITNGFPTAYGNIHGTIEFAL